MVGTGRSRLPASTARHPTSFRVTSWAGMEPPVGIARFVLGMSIPSSISKGIVPLPRGIENAAHRALQHVRALLTQRNDEAADSQAG